MYLAGVAEVANLEKEESEEAQDIDSACDDTPKDVFQDTRAEFHPKRKYTFFALKGNRRGESRGGFCQKPGTSA